MNTKHGFVFNIVFLSLLIPTFSAALSPAEHWITVYLFQRGEISYYGYAVIRIIEMAIFALATSYLAYQAFAPKRWTIPCLGIGFVISVLLLTQCDSKPLFVDFDLLRAFLTTAYGVVFLLALSGKVSA